jgi:hypothetical protein
MANPGACPCIWELRLYHLAGSGQDRIGPGRGAIYLVFDHGQDGQGLTASPCDLRTQAQRCLGVRRTIGCYEDWHGRYLLN